LRNAILQLADPFSLDAVPVAADDADGDDDFPADAEGADDDGEL
jgi:hypothetical protein